MAFFPTYGFGIVGSLLEAIDLDNTDQIMQVLQVHDDLREAHNLHVEMEDGIPTSSKILRSYRQKGLSATVINAGKRLAQLMMNGRPNERVAFLANVGPCMGNNVQEVAYFANASDEFMRETLADGRHVPGTCEKVFFRFRCETIVPAQAKADDSEEDAELQEFYGTDQEVVSTQDMTSSMVISNSHRRSKYLPSQGGSQMDIYPGQDMTVAEVNTPNPLKFIIFRQSKKDPANQEFRLYPGWERFDWSSKDDISRLNKHRNQHNRRGGGTTRKMRPFWTLLERLELQKALGEELTRISGMAENIDWTRVALAFNTVITGKRLRGERAAARSIQLSKAMDSAGRFVLGKETTLKRSYTASDRTSASIRIQVTKWPSTRRLLGMDGGVVDSHHEGDHDDDDYESIDEGEDGRYEE